MPIFAFAQSAHTGDLRIGDMRLELKLPHINYLSLQPSEEFKDHKLGFLGYGLGIEHCYNDRRKFFSTSASLVLTFEWPFPVHIDRHYNKSLYSYYITATDNFIIDRFTFGYGLNYASNHWIESYRDMNALGLPETSRMEYVNKAVGITLNSYYRIGKSLHVGAIYRPTWRQGAGPTRSIFEHLVSLELNWRIRLNSHSSHKVETE